MPAESTAGRWIRRLTLGVAGVLAVLLTVYVLENPSENLATDWIAFDRAADRLLGGEDVYRPYDAETESLPYLYPPFALWLALPLALVGFVPSFLLSAALTIGAMVLAAKLLLRLAPADLVDRPAAFTATVTTGAVLTAAFIGQYSGLFALSLAAACHLWRMGRMQWAGVALALLWLKPNLAIVVPVVLVWSRSWPVARGFAVGSVGLLASSLPFGVGQWRGFVSNIAMMAELQRDDVVPFDKMITAQASIQRLTGLGSESPVLWALWGGVVLISGLAVLEVWRRGSTAVGSPRAFGVLALFMVAANARLYFYDGVLVAIGCLALFVGRSEFGGERLWRLTTVLMACAWVALWGGVWLDLNVLTGPTAAALVVVTGLDARINGSHGLSIAPAGVSRVQVRDRARVGSATKERT